MPETSSSTGEAAVSAGTAVAAGAAVATGWPTVSAGWAEGCSVCAAVGAADSWADSAWGSTVAAAGAGVGVGVESRSSSVALARGANIVIITVRQSTSAINLFFIFKPTLRFLQGFRSIPAGIRYFREMRILRT